MLQLDYYNRKANMMKTLNRRHFLGAGLLLGATSLLGKTMPAKPITIPQEYKPPIIAFPEKRQ